MADGKMAKVRIMIVDDHEVVRSGLKAILEPKGDFDVVGEAASGEEAIAQVAAHRPGVVLMDVRMEEMRGIEACRAIKSAHPEVNVLMLTSYSEEEAVTAAIMAGASAYLLKNVGRSELIKAIRGVAAGQNQLDPAVTRQVMEKLARLIAREEAQGVAELSQRGREVMAPIAEGATNRGIAARW